MAVSKGKNDVQAREKSIRNAKKLVLKGTTSIRAAARQYDIPYIRIEELLQVTLRLRL